MSRIGMLILGLALVASPARWASAQADSAHGAPRGSAPGDSAAGTVPAGDSAASGDSGGAAAPAAPPAESWAAKLKVSGYATASYTYSSHNTGEALVGRFYDRFQDQIELNAAKVVVEKPVATDKWDAGARVDLLLGQNAAVIKSAGLDLGSNADLPQAFATFNIPAGPDRYVQLKAGKIATLMGVEVIEDVVNPNLSVGNQFVYLENFTNTGLRVDVKPSTPVDFQVAVFNGWDVVTDNNGRKSFMARVGLSPTALTTVGLLGYFGPEQPGNNTSNRYGGEVVLTQKVGSKTTVYAQGDYGEEEDLPAPGQKAKWWGVGVWATHDLTPKLNLAVRGDYIDDKNGARTSGVFGFPPNTRQKFGSGTATLNIKTWENALLRPEVRYDRSSLAVYGEASDPKKDQVSFALGASYVF